MTVAAPGTLFAIDAGLAVDEADGQGNRHGDGGGSGGGDGHDRPFIQLAPWALPQEVRRDA